jgi:hypothetical protein
VTTEYQLKNSFGFFEFGIWECAGFELKRSEKRLPQNATSTNKVL